MKRKNFSPDSVHAPFANYVHGITIEEGKRIIFIAGQVPADKEGNVVGIGDFNMQGEQVIKNLKEVLTEGGASISDLVKVTTYIVGREYTQAGRELGVKHWDKSNPPTSTLIVCAGLANSDFLVEIDAIAII